MEDYRAKAARFVEDNVIEIKVGKPRYGTMPHWEDKTYRYIFPFTLQAYGVKYRGKFGQSIKAGNTPPDAYDILCCLQKGDPGSFEEFCSEFGYDTDSKRAEKTYKLCVKEWEAINAMFGDKEGAIEDLWEIS